MQKRSSPWAGEQLETLHLLLHGLSPRLGGIAKLSVLLATCSGVACGSAPSPTQQSLKRRCKPCSHKNKVIKSFWPEEVRELLWMNGLVPEPAEELGVPGCISGGAEGAAKPSLGIAVSHPQFFRPSIVGFSIFDLLPNRISRFPE